MFYPAHLNLQKRKCLVVGGGTIAERKVVAMLISGGDVTVISPDTTELLTFLADEGSIRFIRREFQTGDTFGYFLVCAATDTTSINTAVFEEAHKLNRIALVNVVDVIPQCTFAAASVVTDGEVMISISTGGKSPATSRRIREYFEEMLSASSLYTLGYENGEPVPIENQGLSYPVYLLLNNRDCILLYDEDTTKIDLRVSLLQRSGANIKCVKSVNAKPEDFDNPFLVISDNLSALRHLDKDEEEYLCEILDDQEHSTHFTPHVVIDENLIIGISARSTANIEIAEKLHKHLVKQFVNRGYGRFIDFLGSLRPSVLNAFSTSKERANYFENLINYVGTDTSVSNTDFLNESEESQNVCCLRLNNTDCTSNCPFNWILHGKMNKVTKLATNLMITE